MSYHRLRRRLTRTLTLAHFRHCISIAMRALSACLYALCLCCTEQQQLSRGRRQRRNSAECASQVENRRTAGLTHTHTGRLTLQPTSQLRSNSDQLNNRSESRSGCQPTEVGCIAKCVLQCCCCCQQQMESCPVPNTDMNQVKVVVCPKRAKNSQRGRFRSSVTKSCDCVAAINCKLILRNTDKVYSYTLLVRK